ncbi:MAG: hypothetical protein ABIB71_00220 [Candidatus Woesearchaeota archaeon]
MSIKSKLNKFCLLAFAALCLNQAAVPASAFLIANLQKGNISIEDAKKKEYPIGEDYTQLEFLCLAYAADNDFERKEGSWRQSSCGDNAKAIQDMYDYLVEKAEKKELKGKLKLNQGIVMDNNERAWHYWLELEMPEGYALYFEPTAYSRYIKLPEMEVPEPIDSLPFSYSTPEQDFKRLCFINWRDIGLNSEIEFTFARENNYGIMSPKAESLLYPGGGIGLLYEILDDFDSYWNYLKPEPENIHPWLTEENIEKAKKVMKHHPVWKAKEGLDIIIDYIKG